MFSCFNRIQLTSKPYKLNTIFMYQITFFNVILTCSSFNGSIVRAVFFIFYFPFQVDCSILVIGSNFFPSSLFVMLVPVVAVFLNLGYTKREKNINFVESYAQGTFPSKLVSMGQAVLMPTK
jgi:uncharacterized membrane protein YqaE (UPF0057 family)